jgi:hypothetical protein
MTCTEQECLDALIEAKQRLGCSPTQADYNKLDLTPCTKTICDKVGWNKGKERAGLSTARSPDESLPVNEDYFHQIETPEKAYWLGFLLGDGCVNDSASHNTVRFLLALSQKDGHHVRAFANSVESEHKITEAENQGTGETRICIANQRFIAGLEKHEVTPEKTHSGGMPQVNKKLQPHLVRGLYDADGTIVEQEKHANVRIATASEKRANELVEIIPADCYVAEPNGIYTIVIGTLAGVKEFSRWAYPDGKATSPKLDRKTPTPRRGGKQ